MGRISWLGVNSEFQKAQKIRYREVGGGWRVREKIRREEKKRRNDLWGRKNNEFFWIINRNLTCFFCWAHRQEKFFWLKDKFIRNRKKGKKTSYSKILTLKLWEKLSERRRRMEFHLKRKVEKCLCVSNRKDFDEIASQKSK